MNKYTSFEAGINDEGRRADRIIRQFLPKSSLGGLYKAFRKGLIRLNGQKIKPESKVSQGDRLDIYKTLLTNREEKENRKESSSSRNISILFENDHLLAVNKAKGQLIHGGQGSLEEQVRAYLYKKLPSSLSFTPGPLHRLDRNTTGLIFFSKSLSGAQEFSRRLRNGEFIKIYLALLEGKLKSKEIWVDNLQRDGKKKITSVEKTGLKALSTFIPVQRGNNCTLVLVAIETGRTHQIRAQAAFHGFPLKGDRKYGASPSAGGYFLHSLTIRSLGSAMFGEESEPVAPLSEEQWKILEEKLNATEAGLLKLKTDNLLEDL